MKSEQLYKGMLVGFVLAVVLVVVAPVAVAQSRFVFGALTRGHAFHQVAIGFDGNSTPLGLSVKDQFERIGGWATQDDEGWTYHAGTADIEATIDAEGSYDLSYSVTAQMPSGLAAVYEFMLFQNGTPLKNCAFKIGFAAGLSDIEEHGIRCFVHANATDRLCVEATNRTNGQDLTVIDAHLVAHRM